MTASGALRAGQNGVKPMRPVKIKDQNADFVKPLDWDDTRDGSCGSLPIRRESVGIYNYHYSAWKPDIEELKLLARGGVVELCCVGIQPPVSVAVVPEHKE
jgi:hypothetical protein